MWFNRPKREDFDSLTPDIRCVALVGQYLQCWSLVEATLNEALRRALTLSYIQSAIVSRNVQLRDKIHILKTIANVIDVDAKRFTASLDTFSGMAWQRNMAAHDGFVPDQTGDGVRFVVVKAKGKLDFPETTWSTDEFFQKFAELETLDTVFTDLVSTMQTYTLERLWKHSDFETMRKQLLPELLHHLSQHSLWPRDSSPEANDQKGDGSPPSPD